MAYIFLDETFSYRPEDQYQNEIRVAEYFRRRGGNVDRIDEDDLHRPDWHVQFKGTDFLCEVKSVFSARRGDNPENDFDKRFRVPVLQHFQQKRLQCIPCMVSVHCDTMTAPDPEITNNFIKWLDTSVNLLYKQEIPMPDNWKTDTRAPGYYFAYFPIPQGKMGIVRTLSISVTFSSKISSLQLFIPSYGGINQRPLEKSIAKAVEQLNQEADYRNKPDIPRVITVSIRDGVALLEWSDLKTLIDKLLSHYVTLSAIAIFRWIPTSDDLFCRWFLSFTVFHNPKATDSLRLSLDVFNDEFAVQI
jgi:hypothetical protein